MLVTVYNFVQGNVIATLNSDTEVIQFAKQVQRENKDAHCFHIDTAGQALYYLEVYCDNITTSYKQKYFRK